ncbi:hypothetical protein [Aliikangiella coralliicola]|uniref:VCBS repeat-containing protein n=1 Tax=Aliikangiella coralliicola TaxID=2592383 RepID=A0A545UEA4_9GAMM|nr:hypothetical protein [Aliikangiella coralliicola]TQV87799.1 hypothetical protein FLL46_10465 [Aliikangiella coralliicola]
MMRPSIFFCLRKITISYFKSSSLTAFGLAALLVGCGGGSSSPPDVVEPPPLVQKLEFKTQQGSNSNFIATIDDIDRSLNASLNKVATLPNNDLVIIGQYATSEEYKDTKGFFARITPDLEIKLMVEDSSGFAGLCTHPSGDYTLARFIEKENASQSDTFTVQIERYDDADNLTQKVFLTDPFAEDYYEFPFSQKEHEEFPYKIESNQRAAVPNYRPEFSNWITYTNRSNFLQLHCIEEELLVSYNYEGLKLTRYDQSLQQQWSQAITTRNFYNSSFERLAHTAIDSHGNVIVATNFPNNGALAYNHRFSTSYEYDPQKLNTSNLLVKAFTPEGALIYEKVIGSEENDLLVDIETINDKLFIGVNNRRLKTPSGANNTTEWDIGLFEVDLSDFSYDHNFLNFDNEDLLRGITQVGEDIYLHGVTGFKQVDTNSWVANGNGFYKKLTNGELTDKESYTEVVGVRHSEIADLTVVSDKLIAVGKSDAPITHSTDRNSSALLYIKAL